MIERKKLPGLLYDKSTDWWFSNIRDSSKPCGRTKHMWSKDRAEARKLYRENIETLVMQAVQASQAEAAVLHAKSWTFVELCARYYDLKQTDGCSPSFLASIKRHLQHFLAWLKGKGFDPARQRASDLTSSLLADYRQMLAIDESISLKTANHYIDHVRMVLLWGWNMHGITHPPLGSIRQFSSRRNTKKEHGRKQNREALSWEELEALLSVADTTDAAIIMLGLNCGFGNMDIGTLKQRDVDLETESICHPRPKTGVQRDFTLWPETVAILKSYLEHHRGSPKDGQTAELFFVGRKGRALCWDAIDEHGRLKRSDAIKSRFRRLFEKAGLERPYGTGFYILRHTYATIIGSNSHDFREVQAALGQVTIQQQETYRHDRKIKAASGQQRIRKELQNTTIPRILRDKLLDADVSQPQKALPASVR